MAKEIIMPKFGFTQEESEILEWLHKEGETVEKGDPIAVVSTDKISMEVEAPDDGILSGIKYQIGDVVPVTEIIAYILQPGEELPAGDEKPKKVEKSTKAPEKDQTKAVTPLAKRLAKDARLDIEAINGTGEKGKVTKADVEAAIAKTIVKPAGKVRATPAARRISREKGIDLTAVAGSGPSGRVQAADVANFTSGTVVQQQAAAVSGKKIPLVGMRRTIAQNMSQSWTQAPHMTLQIDIQVDAMETLRTAINSYAKTKQDRVSMTAFITKAVAKALKMNLIVNSQFTEKEIQVISDVNIGIATALDNGLIVPVIQNADKKKLKDVSSEVRSLAEKARSNKLSSNDLMNGTFTISNLGMYGIDRFTAIINPPQSAILAVGRMNRVYVPTENNLPEVKQIVTFTLSADHRVMDGAQAAKFLADLNDVIQAPEELTV